MTFSLSASGAVHEVKDALVSQAEQYLDEGTTHVVSFLHNLLDRVNAPNTVTVSASGHTGPDGCSGSFQVMPTTPTLTQSQGQPEQPPVS